MIVAGKGRHLIGDGGIQRRKCLALELQIDTDLGRPDRQLRPGQKFGGKRICTRIKLAIRHCMIDETHARRLTRAQRITGQQKFLGARMTDQMRPDHRPTITRHQTDAHMRIGEPRIVGRKHHVAEKRQRAAQPHAIAAHLGDHGLGNIKQGENDLLAFFSAGQSGLARHRRLEPGKIAARRKMRTLAGQDDHVARLILRRKTEGGRQLFVQEGIHRIHFLGVVERKGQRAPVPPRHNSVKPSHVFALPLTSGCVLSKAMPFSAAFNSPIERRKRESMIGYATVGTNDLARATSFFDAVFGEMGAKRAWSNERMAGWTTGKNAPMLMVTKPFDGKPATGGNGTMIALAAGDQETVNKVHAKALSLGGKDEGAPGLRGDNFYGAYFRDLDGNKYVAFVMVKK